MLIDEIFLEYLGKNQTLRQWAEELGIPYKRILSRYNKKWTVSKILSSKKIKNEPSVSVKYKGKTKKLEEWSKVTGIPRKLLYRRYQSGFTPAKIFEKNRISPKGSKKIRIGKDLKTIKEWSKISGISYSTIQDRIRKGLKGKSLISKKNTRKSKTQPNSITLEYKGKIYTVNQIVEKFRLNRDTVFARIRKGLSIEQIISKEPLKAQKKPMSASELKWVKQAQKEYLAGESLIQLSKKYKVSDRTLKRKLSLIGTKFRTIEQAMQNASAKQAETVFQKQLKTLLPNLESWGYELLDKYQGQEYKDKKGKYVSRRQYSLRHTECGKTFKDDLFNPPRCKHCFRQSGTSFAEDQIEQYLKKLKIPYQKNVKMLRNKTGRMLELDFYLPKHQIALEYNGLRWHKEKQFLHETKSNLAQEQGIRLYHLWSHNPMAKILKFLDSLLIPKKTVQLSKVEVKLISRKEAQEFLNMHSLENYLPAGKHWGLYQGVVLQEVLTTRSQKKNLDIVQYCANIKVSGGFKRILEFAKKKMKSQTVTATQSRDLCPKVQGSVFYKNKFQLDRKCPPVAFYTDNYAGFNQVWTARKAKRSFPYNEKLSLLDNLKGRGIYPVWNAGVFKLKLN